MDKIHKIAPLPLQFCKYARQLEVLSNLRNFQSIIIKYLETMPIVYNLETDIRYQQGRGIEKVRLIKRLNPSKT